MAESLREAPAPALGLLSACLVEPEHRSATQSGPLSDDESSAPSSDTMSEPPSVTLASSSDSMSGPLSASQEAAASGSALTSEYP